MSIIGVSELSSVERAALVSAVHQASIDGDDHSIHDVAVDVAPWIGSADRQRVVDAVLRRRGGLGEIQELLDDDAVTDVLVDGPGVVLVERNGQLERSGVVLDRSGVRLLVDRVARHCRPRPELRRPVAHGVLPGGVRATVVLSPTSASGPSIALRRHRRGAWPLEDLAGSFTSQLRSAIDRRDNIVVVGSTGSGKTSLVAALLAEVPADERVVVIEDVAELAVGERCVRLESDDRTDFRELVATSLRLRPDRIVVGEVRGSEAIDVLHALTSGHRGSMATVHAADGPSALRRLALLSGQGDDSIDVQLVREHWRSAVDRFVVMTRDADGRRTVAATWAGDSQ